MQVSLIYKIPSEICIIQLVLVYHFMPKHLGVERFQYALPRKSSSRHVDLEYDISSLAEGARLLPLHGSAISQVTISFLYLLISK